jgi:AraC-like DNA-binding protein
LERKYFALQDFKHFIIPIIYFLIIVTINTTGNFLSINWKLNLIALFSIYAFTYWYLGYIMLVKEFWLKKNKRSVLNKQNRLIKNWTFYLLTLSTLSIIRVLISIYLKFFDENTVSDEKLIWISSLFWMFLFLKALISPEILYGYDVLNDILKKEQTYKLELDNIWNIDSKKESNNIQDSILKPQIDKNILEYINKIEQKALNPESFRDFKFSISDLAKKIKIPTSHLNYIFKYHSKIPFSDYKKTVRIRHSIDLIQSGYLEANTLESLAKEVGFASYNPFFTSFKYVSGQSPKEYIDSLKE